MVSTILDRRTLLTGLAAATGTAILAACGGTDATATTASGAGAAGAATATRPAGAAGTTVATTGSGAATTAGGAAATTGGAATTAGGAATTASTPATTGGSAAAATVTRPATTGSATAGATTAASPAAAGSAVTGTTTGAAPAMMVATGGMPMGPSMCVMGSIVSLGSTALQPLADAAQKAYAAKCPMSQINVQGGGSGTGLTQVFGGQATIGNSDIFAEEANGIDAKQLEDHQVVVQGFGIAANPSVNIASLTQDQIISIWTGKVTNYKDVGGPDQAVVIINRPASSGTRATFKRFALKGMNEAQGKALTEDSSGAVAEAIKGTPGAIGYLALAYFQQDKALKTVNFNGKAPTLENISDDSYPIWSYGHMYTKGPAMGLAKAFIDYILSDDIQKTVVQNLGYFSFAQVKAKHTAM